MRSIPADHGLVLGNLISTERIEHLEKIAEAEKPMNNADRKLQNFIRAEYKLGQIYNQMVNFGVNEETLNKLYDERSKLKKEMSKAAVNLVRVTVTVEKEVRSLQADQSFFSEQIESPIDYSMSKLGQFQLSNDSLQFDVQYFQKQSMDSATYASQISKHVSDQQATARGTMEMGTTDKSINASAANSSVMNTCENHDIEGTIVMTVNCTHQTADIFSPLILDPRKAVQAWNHTFPDDRLETDPASMFKAAMEKTKRGNKCLQLLSGTTKGSTFIGFVHILKRESTDSSQKSESVTSSIQRAYEAQFFSAMTTNGYGSSNSFSKSTSNLLSTSELSTVASMSVVGIIPTIACQMVKTTVKTMKPTPGELMAHLGGIQEITQGAVNSDVEKASKAGQRPSGGGGGGGTSASEAKSKMKEAMSEMDDGEDKDAMKGAMEDMDSAQSKGKDLKNKNKDLGGGGGGGTSQKVNDANNASRYIDMNNQHAEKTVMAMGEIAEERNKVIDSRTMMTSLDNYFEKVKEGEHGVPLNFYVKELPKNYIAKAYVRRYYPNGALSFKDNLAGQLGSDQT